jgi:hypothetical protein
MEHANEQLRLPMLTVYVGPQLVDWELICAAKTYREAVCACWELRTRKHLTRRKLAEGAGLYASHVSDYLSDDPAKRELPAKHINAFEQECGNRFITQWMTLQAGMHVLEEPTYRRAA